MTKPISFFYSYAYEDSMFYEILKKHLLQLKRQGMLYEWDRSQILPGQRVEQEIAAHLSEASLIIVLVSSDYFSSEECYQEMQQALEQGKKGGARVVPVLLRHYDWEQTPLKGLPCLPRDGRPVTGWEDQEKAFLDIVKGLREFIEQGRLASPARSQRSGSKQSRFFKNIRARWIDGVLAHSLLDTVYIPLNLQERPDALANPMGQLVQATNLPPRSLPAATSIVEVYDRSTGGLLILGEPGSGKTTLLLQLTRTLLERAEKDENLPIPAVFHLASWQQKRGALAAWLEEELQRWYYLSRKVAKSWIEENRVLPMLDGLDEITTTEDRIECITKINDYYAKDGGRPLVVCCRSKDYALLSPNPKSAKKEKRADNAKLKFLHAVSILDLTNEQITTYLESTGTQLNGLQESLANDTDLHSLASQAFMLKIMARAYQGVPAWEVVTGEDPEKMRATIYSAYIKAMLNHRQQLLPWEKRRMLERLRFLARQLQRHHQTEFSIENLQPDWLAKNRVGLYKWSVAIMLSLTLGVTGIIPLELLLVGNFTSLASQIGGLLLFVGATLAGRGRAEDPRIVPAEVLGWSWEQFLTVPIGVLLLEIVTFVTGGFHTQLSNMLSGPVSAMMLTIIWGAVRGKRLPRSKRTTFKPNEGIWRSFRNGLICFLIAGLIPGFTDGLRGGFIIGVFSGLFCGTLVGLICGLEAFSKHFLLRFAMAWRGGNLPWKLVAFLEEGRRRSFLLPVGGSYAFIHRMLLEHFATLDEAFIHEAEKSELPGQN